MSELVERAIAAFDRLLADQHLDSTIELLQRATARQRICSDNGAPACTALRPLFLDGQRYAELMRAAELVMGALERVGEQLLADPELRHGLGIPAYLDPILAMDAEHGAAPVFARLDGLVSAEGELRFIEYNGHTGGGVALSDEMQRAFDKMPVVRAFAARQPLRWIPVYDVLEDAIHERQQRLGRPGPPRIGVVQTGPLMHQNRDNRWLPYLASRGCLVALAPAEHYDYRDGRLRLGTLELDWVVLMRWDEVYEPPDAMGPVFQAIRDGAVLEWRGIAHSLIKEYKHVFELLTAPEHRGRHDEATWAALQRHVPWTRVLRPRETTYEDATVDLLPFVEQNRERLVLKPGGGLGGKGVVLGFTVDDGAWRAAVKRARRRNYVVQELVPLRTREHPLLRDGRLAPAPVFASLAPWIWNGERAAGAVARLSVDAVTNVASGGSLAPVAILDG